MQRCTQCEKDVLNDLEGPQVKGLKVKEAEACVNKRTNGSLDVSFPTVNTSTKEEGDVDVVPGAAADVLPLTPEEVEKFGGGPRRSSRKPTNANKSGKCDEEESEDDIQYFTDEDDKYHAYMADRRRRKRARHE